VTPQLPHHVEDGAAWLTINPPRARNALNRAVREGLMEAFLAAEQAGPGDRRRRADRHRGQGRVRRRRPHGDPVYRSADAQEGARAFADKRTPRWPGR
jgi:enoyl-CoA hydratase/carnithine racemase